MRRFLEDIDSPNVEAILDPVNLISAEHVADQDEEINKAFRLYGDRISVVHVKDFVMKEGKQFAHVGEGLFHYEPLMKNLKKDKPYITMLLENSTKERYHQDVEYLQKNIRCSIKAAICRQTFFAKWVWYDTTRGFFKIIKGLWVFEEMYVYKKSEKVKMGHIPPVPAGRRLLWQRLLCSWTETGGSGESLYT